MASPKPFSIDSEEAPRSLLEFGRQSTLQILFATEKVKGIVTNPVHGSYEPIDALRLLLKGTSLVVSEKSDGVLVVEPQVKARNSVNADPASANSVGNSTRVAQSNSATATDTSVPSQNSLSASSNSEKAGLSEIIVTASKREEKLHDVAMGVTALGGEVLNRTQSVGFDDYAALVPGLSLQSSGAGSDRLTLRGENSGGVGSTVAIYIDDSPIGSSTALANGGIYTADIDPWDLQRIEVLRGPQGTLYGAGAEGGLIKFVANQPNPNQFGGAFEIGGVQVEHGQAAGSVKGMVNLPLFGGKAALRVSAFEEMLPGYIDNPQLGGDNVNHGSKAGFRASLLVQPTDDLSIKLTAFNQYSRIDGLPSIDVVGASLSYAAPPSNIFQPLHGDLSQNRFIREYQKSDVSNYSAVVNWNLGAASLTSITSYGTERFSNLVDQTSTEAAPGLTYGALISSAITGVPTGLLETGVLPLQKWTEEVRLASNPSDKWEWQVGVFYTHERSNFYQVLTDFNIPDVTPQSGPVAGGAALPATYEEWAGFGDVIYHFDTRFDVAIGGRYSANDQHAAYVATPGTLTGPASSSPSSSNGDVFTYSVAPRWHINNDTLVYTRIATGYRPGGPNNVPSSAPSSVPRIYSSDSTKNYEVGFRSDLFDKRLSIDVATFYIDWSQIQLNEVVDNVGITSNGGSARSMGVEWTLGLAPIQGLRLNLAGAYVDAKLTDDAPGVGGHSGDRLPFAPSVSTSLDGEYQWPISSNYTAFVGGTYSFVGSRHTNFSTIAFLDPHTKLPSYNTVNLRTGVLWGGWTVEVYAKNLSDERGLTGYSNSGTPNLGGSIGIIQPRTFGVTLSTKF